MVQMSFEGLQKVDIDYADATVPESVKIVRPLLFQQDNAFCCVLGPDPQRGIIGCGYNVADTLKDFDKHLQARRNNHETGDEVAIFIEAAYTAAKGPDDPESSL